MTWHQIIAAITIWLFANAAFIAYLLADYRREQKRGAR
jgi:hypothetical protein